jgi:GT2 family glycosyltransferase
VLFDTSLEFSGDLLGALVGALDDPAVAVAGPFGLATSDLRDYEERTVGDVAAVQGYCLAARRTDLASVGGFRESFAFYRNADIDLSLRLRTVGGAVRRAVAMGAEHCRRHLHRAWEATPEAERAELSRRNMRRVHKRFGERTDLTVP